MQKQPDDFYQMRGRSAIVTGAGQGIGRAIAMSLARDGVRVALCGRTLHKLQNVAQVIAGIGGQAMTVEARVDKKNEVHKMVARVIDTWGEVDYLVNNAGISRSGWIVELKEEQWDDVIDTNLKGAFLVSQAVAQRMIERQNGSIVNICSIASYGGQEGRASYAASKAGLMALTYVMAQELASSHIRVNGVAPALIGTEMIQKGVPRDFLDNVILDRKPMGRLGTPEEVAEAVLFLLSDRSSYITGEILRVDGGLLSGYFCSNRHVGQSFKRV